MPPRLLSSDRSSRRLTQKTLGKPAFSLEDTLVAKGDVVPVARRATVGAPTSRFLGPVPSADLLTSPSGLVHDAVRAAYTSIRAIETQLPIAADALRWRGEQAAGPQLDAIIRHAKNLVLLAALAGEITGLNLRDMRKRDRSVSDTIDATSDALDRLLSCQDAGDAFGLADALADHLAPAMSGWRIVFDTIAAEVRHAA